MTTTTADEHAGHADCLSDWPPTEMDRKDAVRDLKEMLDELAAHDDFPDGMRHVLVLMAAGVATIAGFNAGMRTDAAGRVVACIDLPTGQVAWPLTAHTSEIDDLRADVRGERIRAWIGGAS